jgi:hypothetical protein
MNQRGASPIGRIRQSKIPGSTLHFPGRTRAAPAEDAAHDFETNFRAIHQAPPCNFSISPISLPHGVFVGSRAMTVQRLTHLDRM